MRLTEYVRTRRDAPQGYREILRVGFPLVAGMGSATVMQFTDRLFLSRYSVDAIGAALPASMVSLSLTMIFIGVCGYTSVLIAQYVGSGAPQRVGAALWQGIWIALVSGLLLCLTWWAAPPAFALVGHDAHIQELEVTYFRVLTMGSLPLLLGPTLGGFFSGRGQTRPVMLANVAAMLLNVPLDYFLIFGFSAPPLSLSGTVLLPGFTLPPLGIFGAGLATVIGWIFAAAILAAPIFTRDNDRAFGVFSHWRFEGDMFRRLLRYGLPSGFNLFMEVISFAWFCLEVGRFGRDALAASNIAFSVNSIVFVPMLGLNFTVAALVGQAMGRGKPDQAEFVTLNTLHIALAYMLPVSAIIALFAGPIMDVFAPGDLSAAQFAPVRELGVVFIYFIAVYSLVDAANVVYFGALKGAGDTLGVLYALTGGLVLLLFLPIWAINHFGLASVLNYWKVFTVYVMLLALIAMYRFYCRKWHTIRVVETMGNR